MRRFELTIERKVILYAEDEMEARFKAQSWMAGNPVEAFRGTGEVRSVEELPELDKRGEIIDVSPKQASMMNGAAKPSEKP